jgi:hypothetical protein
MLRDRSFFWLLCCFLLSGVAALIYGTAWTHEFAFVFGTSTGAARLVFVASPPTSSTGLVGSHAANADEAANTDAPASATHSTRGSLNAE